MSMQTSRSNVSGSRIRRLFVPTLTSATALLVLLVAPAAAMAKKRVVVLQFVGPQAKKAQAQVMGRIRKNYAIIPQAVFQKVAKQLKIRRPTDDDVANVARKLRADAILAGVVEKSGKKQFQVVLTVRDGSSGTVIDRVTIPLRGGRFGKPALAKVDSELVPLLERGHAGSEVAQNSGSASPASGDTENPLDKPRSSGKSAVEPAAAPLGSSDPAGRALGASENPAPPTTEATVSHEAPATERPAWRPYATVSLALVGVGRSLTFDGNTPMNLQGYSGSPVFGVGLGAELNPLAARPGALRGLGLYFSLEKVLSVSSTYSPPAGAKRTLDSSELNYTLGLQYGYRLHEEPGSITVGGRFGYGQTSFEITVPTDISSVITVPDVSYGYLDVGPFIKIPFELASSWWELGARFSYLPVLSAGMLTDGGRNHSIAPGSNGSASGIELALTLGWHLRQWLELQGGFRLDRFATSFDTGAAANGASDLFYSFGLGAGIVY
jgi:hypothetical protein